MYGLFVKRHFEATALYCPSSLIYAHAVGGLSQKFEVVITEKKNSTEVIVYYRDCIKAIPGITPLVKGWRFVTALRKGVKVLKNKNKKFNFIHIHILSILGIFGLYYKYFRGIPYGITEHWSRYLPATGNYAGQLRKMLTKKVVAHADFVSTVTENLRLAMLNHGLGNKNYFVLPNVVAPEFYKDFQGENKERPFTFVHLSSFEDKSKNISGIIRVIEKLGRERDDFLFRIIGDGMDFEELKSFAEETISYKNLVEFTGLLEGDALVRALHNADVMVIFSHYENFPVVINEAFVLGLPVIATRVGGIPEMVDGDSGVLISPDDEEALVRVLKQFINHEIIFNKKKIKEKYRSKFSLESVGKILCGKYSL